MLLKEMFEKKDWFRALDLKERGGLVVDWESYQENPNNQLLLDKWRKQKPFNDPSVFTDKLDSLRITDHQFENIVLEKVRLNFNEADFAWLETLKDAFLNLSNTDSKYLDDNNDTLAENLEICSASKSVISRALTKLKQQCTNAFVEAAAFNIDIAIKAFIPLLLERLSLVMIKVFVQEMYFAKSEGWLTGQTPEARYQSYVALYDNPEYSVLIFRQYPVLARQVVRTIDSWSNFCYEFLSSLHKDYSLLQNTFSQKAPLGKFTEIRNNDGDPHDDGRSVLIAVFESGLPIVYKPRSLDVDVKYNNLVSCLNNLSDFDFKTPLVINFGDYGWVEFINHKECETKKDVEKYYRRYGGLSALLFCLRTTDIHNENLVASGSQPVLIDLESMLYSKIANPLLTKEQRKCNSHSLSNIGLLPGVDYAFGGGHGFDMSALAGIAGQVDDVPRKRWIRRRTDEMESVDAPTRKTQDKCNLVLCNGKVVNPLHFQQQILLGFTAVYRLLLQNKNVLLQEGELIDSFADSEVRSVIRSTVIYSSLLYNLFLPNSLRDALAQDRCLDILWLSYKDLPDIAVLTGEEMLDLKDGDIPIFKAVASSTSVISSHGDVIKDALVASPLESVRKRLRELSEEDLEVQLGIIRKSMYAFEANESIQLLYIRRSA